MLFLNDPIQFLNFFDAVLMFVVDTFVNFEAFFCFISRSKFFKQFMKASIWSYSVL